MVKNTVVRNGVKVGQLFVEEYIQDDARAENRK